MKDERRYRMYYQCMSPTHGDNVCYAESNDGIVWKKPSLGLFPSQDGSKDNNIVWHEDGMTHVLAPFRDQNPIAPPNERYKALVGVPPTALASHDGIHWQSLWIARKQKVRFTYTPVMIKGEFDSHNLAFWDSQRRCYVAFFRGERDGRRDIMTATSQDFLNWSEPAFLTYKPAMPYHLYTNAITAYFRAPHLYLGFPMRFMPGRMYPDRSRGHGGAADGLFITSRDGLNWDRRFREPFVRPGPDPYNWDRSNMAAWGIVPTGPREISIYYTENFGSRKNRLRRATFRTDGFISIRATDTGGEFVTKPLTFEGRRLVINYETSAVGGVKVEIQTAGGRPVPQFSVKEADEIWGDEIDRIVTWGGRADLAPLTGRVVRLRFVMKDADLYSLCFCR